MITNRTYLLQTVTSRSYAAPWAAGQPKPSSGDCVFSQQTTGFNTEWYATALNVLTDVP